MTFIFQFSSFTFQIIYFSTKPISKSLQVSISKDETSEKRCVRENDERRFTMNLSRYGKLASTSPAFAAEPAPHTAMPQPDLNCVVKAKTSIVCASFSLLRS